MATNISKHNRQVWEAVKKGDLTVADLISDGGYLQREEENRFIRKVYESTPLLSKVRQVEMNSPKRRIHKIGITGNFLNKAPDSGEALDASKRSKVFTEYVDMETTELIGSMYIPYDVIEDNIERGTLENTLMDEIIPAKIGRDLEKVLIQGDTNSGDGLLSSFDGILAQCTTGSNLLAFNQVTGAVDDDFWAEILETLPIKYREREDALEFMVNHKISDAWMHFRRLRATLEGDRMVDLNHMATLSYRGVPITKVYNIPEAKGLLTLPQNLILGIQRGTSIETARDIEARVIIIVVTMRVAVAIEEKEAVVEFTGANPSGTTTSTTTT